MSPVLEIGPHRLLVGDLTVPTTVPQVMRGGKASVVYCDPPWGQALLTQFAGKAGGPPRLPWLAFLDALAFTISAHAAPDAPIFVEMGRQWVGDMDEAMKRWAMPLLRRWEVTYGSNKAPSTVALYGTGPAPDITLPNTHGEAVTRSLLGAVVKPGDIVLDPCMGLGMTARVAHPLGGHVRGVELVPERMERTATWLRKHVENAAFWRQQEERKREQGA